MSTTIRELLDLVTFKIEQTEAGPALPPQAATVIGHCGRALHELAFEGPSGLGARRMHAVVTGLASTCQSARLAWPSNDLGSTEAVAGAAADAIARASGPMLPTGRWSLAIAVAEVARRCADRAQAFPPCDAVPELAAVHTAAAQVEQVAAMYPPTLTGDVALDTAIPSVRPAEHLTGLAAAAEAAPALAAAVHARAARGDLTIAELLACAATAEAATRHAVALASRVGLPDDTHPTWAAAPAAWRAVHRSCAPFDDGTKMRPPSNRVIAWAAHMERAARSHLRISEAGDLADAATAMRTVMNHLPGVADDLALAVDHWARGNYLLARERRLVSYEDRNLDATNATNRVVFARDHDLDDLALAVWDARRLSADLAAELDRSSRAVGVQAQPGMSAAHAEATRSAGASVMKVHATRTEARAAATAGPRQWSFAARSQTDGPLLAVTLPQTGRDARPTRSTAPTPLRSVTEAYERAARGLELDRAPSPTSRSLEQSFDADNSQTASADVELDRE